MKASLHLGLCKLRCAFVALVRILVKNRAVMLAGIFTTFDHEQYQIEKLGVGVVGVVDMCR